MNENTEKDSTTGLRQVNVLDTTVVIENPAIIYSSGQSDWVIPMPVLREIDGLKNNEKELVAKAARQLARTLDRLGSYGDLAAGVKLSTGSVLRIVTEHDQVDGLASNADNRIVGTALKLKNAGEKITLLTTDTNMRTVARAYGVKAEYPHHGVLDETPVNDMQGEKMTPKEYKGTRKLGILVKVFALYLTPFVITALGLKYVLGNDTAALLLFSAVTILPIMMYTIRVPHRMFKFVRYCEMNTEVYFKCGTIRKWIGAIKYGIHDTKGVRRSDDNYDEIDYFNALWATDIIKFD